MYLAPMLKRPCRLFDRSHSYVTEADPDQTGANGIVAPGSLYSAPVGSTKSPPGMWSPKEVSASLSPPCSISPGEAQSGRASCWEREVQSGWKWVGAGMLKTKKERTT